MTDLSRAAEKRFIAVAPPLWLLAFAGFSLLYITLPDFIPSDWRWLFKIIPIALLLQLALTNTSGKVRALLGLGLVLSAIGDVLLALEGLFVQGLAAFLLAQVIYAVLFLSQSRWQPRRLPWAALIVAYALVCTLLIVPEADGMRAPVTAYMIAISMMAIAAGFRDESQFLWVAMGALIFMVSDTLIAVNLFVLPFEYSGIAVMVTYYTAQLLICVGIVSK
ncbi:lysoplasmalogenase [Pseudohongiella sp.]|uniref:YhhN-like protein n=1 Tax=marine sediment metagenome TaxID=412755 RepID=A0A0F9Y328_9ZZZZ|nr:lysoplasmalogenase [Pseudohongiella sp.]HDZ08938.1 lysoplasmalogenase [Pseudohongiella sp.]HEA63984.1 lysoplasmalogenase [Pseudohongiella sp.]